MEDPLSTPKHEGAKIAILGSGPSLVEALDADYDVGIAVNAAIRMPLLRFNYFLSNHGYAHSEERGWKKFLDSKPEVGILINSLSAAHWERVVPNFQEREQVQAEYQQFIREDSRTQILQDGAHDDGKPVNNFYTLDFQAELPNCVYNKIPIPQIQGKLLDERVRLVDGASSAGAAVHMATLMGAKAIDLYGVQMTNEAGGNYAIQHNPAEKGRSSPVQRANLERLFDEAHERGIQVRVHGEHTFTNTFLGE